MISERTGAGEVEDVVRELGYLTLGTRLKRIGEQLQADTQRILELHGLPVAAGMFPFLAALDRCGPLNVGELALAVGVAQPGATRAVARLTEDGHVTITHSTDDLRRKRVALSPTGKRLVAAGKRTAWPQVEQAVRDLCEGLQGSLLEQLAALEDGLAVRPLEQRVSGKREKRS